MAYYMSIRCHVWPVICALALQLMVLLKASESTADDNTFRRSISAELKLEESRVRLGSLVTLTMRITNRSDVAIEFFNPTFDRSLSIFNRTVVLAMLTADGDYIGDLLHVEEGSVRSVQRSDWKLFPPGATVKNECSFSVGIVPGTRFVKNRELPAGRYLLELRVHEHAVSGRPSSAGSEMRVGRPNMREWEQSFPGPVVVKATRCALDILPRTGD